MILVVTIRQHRPVELFACQACNFSKSVRSLRPLARVTLQSSKGKAYFNYLANDWDYKPEGAPLPWETAGMSIADLLPPSDAERQAVAYLEEKVPKWREGFLTPDDEVGVRRRFRILAEVAGGDEPGLAALRRNLGVMCIGEEVSRAAAEALVVSLGRDGAADVVRKNPGVLAIKASSLTGDGLARTVAVANIIDFFLGPGKIFVEFVKLLASASVVKIIIDFIFIQSGLTTPWDSFRL